MNKSIQTNLSHLFINNKTIVIFNFSFLSRLKIFSPSFSAYKGSQYPHKSSNPRKYNTNLEKLSSQTQRNQAKIMRRIVPIIMNNVEWIFYRIQISNLHGGLEGVGKEPSIIKLWFFCFYIYEIYFFLCYGNPQNKWSNIWMGFIKNMVHNGWSSISTRFIKKLLMFL